MIHGGGSSSNLCRLNPCRSVAQPSTTLVRSFGIFGPDKTPLDVSMVESRVMKICGSYDKIDASSVSWNPGLVCQREQRVRRRETRREHKVCVVVLVLAPFRPTCWPALCSSDRHHPLSMMSLSNTESPSSHPGIQDPKKAVQSRATSHLWFHCRTCHACLWNLRKSGQIKGSDLKVPFVSQYTNSMFVFLPRSTA